MYQPCIDQACGRSSGYGCGVDMDGGRNGQRDGRRFAGQNQSPQANRVYKLPHDEEIF